MSAGAIVWDFGECIEPELNFSMNLAGAKIGCYIDAGVAAKLKVISENGLPPTRKQERKIEAGINRGEFNRVSYTDFGEYKHASNVKSLYESELKAIIPTKLHGIRAEFKTSSKRISDFIDKIIMPKIDLNGERIIIHLSSDGKKVSAYSEETGYVFYEKMIILASKIAFENGQNVALPYSFPVIADDIAKKYGQQAYRITSYNVCYTKLLRALKLV